MRYDSRTIRGILTLVVAPATLSAQELVIRGGTVHTLTGPAIEGQL